MKRSGIFLSSLAYIVAIAVLLIGFSGSFAGNQGGLSATVFLFVLPVISICILVVLYNFVPKITKRNYRIMLVIMVFLSLATSIMVLLSVIARNIGWDPGYLFELAGGYAGVDGGSLHELKLYLTRYNNNVFLALVIILVTQIANLIHVEPYVLAGIINSALLFVSTTLIMYVSHRLFGRRGVVVSWALSLVMISASPWVATFYSDTLGLFLVAAIGTLLLELTRRGGRSYLWASALGLSVAVGFLIKPTVIILLVALAMSYGILVMVKSEKVATYLMRPLGVSLLLFILMIGGFKYCIEGRIIDDQKAVEAMQLSADHFMAMGSLRGLPPYTECKRGGYCTRMIHDLATRQDLDTREERWEYHANLLKDSILTDFPVGYVGFALDKLSRSFGDGSFGVWTEGMLEQEYLVKLRANELLREFFIHNGRYLGTSHLIWQSVWLAILTLSLIALISELMKSVRYKKVSFLVLGFAIAIIGLACYQVIFESRARYIFLYLPLFIILATWGLSVLAGVLGNKLCSISGSN